MTTASKRWSTVAQMTRNAKGMAFDGCHKIYLLMDDAEVKNSESIGYTVHEPDIDKLKEWWAQADADCGLQFIHAVFTHESDPNAGFVNLLEQFEEVDE